MSTDLNESETPKPASKLKKKANVKKAKAVAGETVKTKQTTYKSQSPIIKRSSNFIKQAGDPTRLAILFNLREIDTNVTELCRKLGQLQPAVSHHLALLRFSGLVEANRVGKNSFYVLTDSGKKLVKFVKNLIDEA